MKIAVVDHYGNTGGSSRVVRSLLPAIIRADRDISITYFGTKEAIKRENLAEHFQVSGIKIRYLSGYKARLIKVVNSEPYAKLRGQISGKINSGILDVLEAVLKLPVFSMTKEVEKIAADFDLFFFPWPFHMDCPTLDIPMVGIFHDFNYKYYFSGQCIFSPLSREKIERQMPVWLGKCTPVVSSKFIKEELKRFYPFADKKTRIVHLPRLSEDKIIPADKASDTILKLGIKSKYILFPTHMVSHKNVGPLIAATALLISRGYEINLILTGAGTESIRGIATLIGVQLDDMRNDVYGLGYVSNHEIDCLIACASVVVNSSLYEAGNGSGVDAWASGIPVAMSNIPAFVENMEVLDVRASLFDPRSPADIADKISLILDNDKNIAEGVEHSKKSMRKITWDNVGDEYCKIFKSALS